MARQRKESINKTVAIRMTPEMRAALEVFASKTGVNSSEAARNLIAWALPRLAKVDYDSMEVDRQNARAEWVAKVNAGWRAAMTELMRIGEE